MHSWFYSWLCHRKLFGVGICPPNDNFGENNGRCSHTMIMNGIVRPYFQYYIIKHLWSNLTLHQFRHPFNSICEVNKCERIWLDGVSSTYQATFGKCAGHVDPLQWEVGRWSQWRISARGPGPSRSRSPGGAAWILGTKRARPSFLIFFGRFFWPFFCGTAWAIPPEFLYPLVIQDNYGTSLFS